MDRKNDLDEKKNDTKAVDAEEKADTANSTERSENTESTESTQSADSAADAEKTPETPGSVKKVRRAERRLSDFQSLIIRILIFVFILYIVFGHIVGLMMMPNGDMYPRIDSGDLLLFYRLDKDPKAQDIIAFTMNNTRYVARVVAVEGDTVEITEEGSVLINGNSVIESNIFYETYPLEGFTTYPVTLGEDECFVLADSRRGAEDSRYFGPVKYSDIIGTVITVMRRNNL